MILANSEISKSSGTQESQEQQEPEKTNEESCLELGCPEGTQYVGSENSDKYYECSCHYASKILEENIVCFKSELEAQDDERVRSEC